MRQQKTRIRRFHKPLIITGIVVAVLLVLTQLAFDAYVYRNQSGDQSVITNLIISSVETLHKPAAIDPKTGNVYLTESHLVLPPRTDFAPQQILYSDNSSQESGTDVGVTTRFILGSAESKLWSAQAVSPGWHRDPMRIFNEVPNLQSCARGVQLFSKPQTQSDSFRLKSTKQLTDGRTLYIYTETSCQYDLTTLTEYLKEAQSY